MSIYSSVQDLYTRAQKIRSHSGYAPLRFMTPDFPRPGYEILSRTIWHRTPALPSYTSVLQTVYKERRTP